MKGPIKDRSMSISSFLINVRPDYDVVSLKMSLAKIQFSEEELLLVQNAEWLLTKNRIIKKVYEVFGSMVPEIQKLFMIPTVVPNEIFIASAKISKGENYQGLPYVMLDYPRSFGKSDIFAMRTMFWWGNFFSATLHLKGRYKSLLVPLLNSQIQVLAQENFSICISGDEWRHDFNPDNYVSIRSANEQTIVQNLMKNDFCKIAAKIPLQEWDGAVTKLLAFYQTLVGIMRISSPNDERDL